MGAVARDRLPRWRKSRRCDTASCVEAAPVGDHMWVRDSGHPGGSVLRFSAGAWRVFLAEARESKLTKAC